MTASSMTERTTNADVDVDGDMVLDDLEMDSDLIDSSTTPYSRVKMGEEAIRVDADEVLKGWYTATS